MQDTRHVIMTFFLRPNLSSLSLATRGDVHLNPQDNMVDKHMAVCA